VAATTLRLLADRASAEPDRTALVVDGVGALTFGDWAVRTETAAAGLAARGVRPGDPVGLRFGAAGWIDYAVGFCAVHRAGAIAVPVPAGAPPGDLDRMLGDCAAVGLLHEDGAEPGWRSGWAAPVGALETAGGTAPEAPVRPDDLAQILYTSGTTGRPKGVAATHANLTFGCGGRRRPFAHSEHLAHAFPIGTNAAQLMLTTALDARPTVVTLPRFTPARFAELIQRYAVGTVFVVPAMAIELLAAGAPDRYDLSSVLLLGSAAAPLPGEVAARLVTAFPQASLVNYYTSTEAAPAQTVMMYDPHRPGSVGRALAGGQVRVAVEGGGPERIAAAGETGEVWLRSPAAPRAYYGDDEASGRVFRGGWVRMGDLGYLDADGYLYLVDRAGDVVKSGAHKISTLRVEEAVYQHPAVVEAAVVGVPHPVLGKRLAVAVVAREPLAAERLRAFLAERLPAHEVPARVVQVDALPRNTGGKVDKRAVLQMLT
jgi:acyl-CoA synthetase (AMP-forming)/AMP-acid ligase II